MQTLVCRVLLSIFLCLPAACAARGDDALRQAIERFVQEATAHYAAQVRVWVDPRRAAVRCSTPEPYLPAGARLWGQSVVAVRCGGSSTPGAFVPVRVSAFAPYVVAARPLPAGHQVSEADLVLHTGDLTELNGPVATAPEQVVGRLLASPVMPGQPLRLALLRKPVLIRANQTVRLVSRGAGFTVTAEGRAIEAAADGERVQVRTASGQVVSGVARPGPIVEVSF